MNSESRDSDGLRILLGAYWFVTATVGLANELAKHHRVMYITTRHAAVNAGDKDWRQVFDPRVEIRVENYFLARSNPLYYLERVVGLRRGLRQFGADVFHLQDAYDPVLYCALPWMQSVPLVLTVHDPVPHAGEDAKFLEFYERRKDRIFAMRRRADHIITLGQGVKEQLLEVQPELDPERISVVLHFPMRYMLHWKRPDQVEKPGSVLFFGRINAYKGLGVMLDAWSSIRERCPNARLVVAGKGNDLLKHRDRILGDDRCELMDRRVSVEEVSELFAEASVVVLPYMEATQSGPLSIAVAFGKPVVASDVGGLPELVDCGQSGLIVPPGDPTALADAVTRILRDDALRTQLSLGAAHLDHGRLSPEVLVEETEAVYRQAMYHNKLASGKRR